MKETFKAVLPSAGGIAAATASALCCAGPILAVTVGVSGAGFASTFEPLRPYFLVATAVFLVLGFWLLGRESKDENPGVSRFASHLIDHQGPPHLSAGCSLAVLPNRSLC